MTAALRVSIEKEVRALLVPFLACAAAIAVLGVAGGARVFMPASGIAVFGAIVIGAWSIGHEYSGRTLSLWLSQPVARHRLVAIKFGSVAVLVLALAALVRIALFRGGAEGEVLVTGNQRLAAFVLPALIGLFLAPWLTMLCRSPLAGSIFTLAVLAAASGGGNALSALGYGPPAGASMVFADFRLRVLSAVVIVLSPIAAIGGWITFMRIEAIDGGERHLGFFDWWSAGASSDEVAAVRRQRPLLQLVTKELHIQEMTFAVALLYVLLWAANALVSYQNPEMWLLPGPVTLLYCVLLGLLAGSLASAEERQYGTLEWQVLQPIATSTQWVIKAGVALGLTLVLGLGLPMALALVDPSTNELGFPPAFMAIVLGACVVGLYVSSFTASGVRALLTSILLASAVVPLSRLVLEAIDRMILGRVELFREVNTWRYFVQQGSAMALLRWVKPLLGAALGVAFLVVTFRLALENHRSGERSSALLSRQALRLITSLLLAVALYGVVTATVNRFAFDTRRQQLEHQWTTRPR